MRRALPRRHRRAVLAAAFLPFLALPAPGFAGQAAPTAPSLGKPTASRPGQLAIEHDAPACLAGGKHARLAACFRPPAALARARLYFRAGGTKEWFYVEMSGTPPCLEGALPRPKKGTRRVEYYVAATDRSFAESRTPEHALQVTDDGTCPAGPVAPVSSAASAVVGSASGAAPAGFVTGGGGLSPLLIAGGVAVIWGGAAAVVAGGGGGGEENPPTTTLPPVTTTTTTTTATTTTTTQPPGPTPTTTTTTTSTTTTTTSTTTTTTTTTLAPCETPTQPPIVDIASPRTGDEIFKPVTIIAYASDPAPGSGVEEVRFYWQHRPKDQPPGALVHIGTATSSPYTVTWNFSTCPVPGTGNYGEIRARAWDKCRNQSQNDSVVGVALGDCPAFVGSAQGGPAGAWVSELSVPGGRGQVVVDGRDAVFPAGGLETFSTPARPGAHRFEATLVDGAGRPGTWRFDLSALGPVAGSLRVVAGEAAVTGPAALVFRLRGKPGERVVFSFEVEGGYWRPGSFARP